MKLSEAKRQAAYSAIHEPIMRLRIELARMPELQSTAFGNEVDFKLAQLVDKIWESVRGSLNIEDQAAREPDKCPWRSDTGRPCTRSEKHIGAHIV